MGVEKEGLKSGGSYVGGFFQLFDWTAKSRKKLFAGKLDLQERSKQGSSSAGNSPLSQVHLMDLDEIGERPSIKGSSDYSCSSSVTEDEGCGVKAPGVVARLMGLDSLPSSHFSEPYSTPSFDTQSLQEANYRRESFNYRHDCPIMYSGNLLDKADGPAAPARKPLEPKPQKTVSRPIEKFQTEILPPKSAKSIPITHHKLLSPIKSPVFVPSRNAAHIMETAVKIIDHGPPATTRGKMSPLGSSSVPLKVQAPKEKVDLPQKLPTVASSSVSLKVKELKEKAEASHKSSRFPETSRRPFESNASRLLKGQSMNKSWNGSQDASFKVFPDIEYSSKNKGKSISLAIQAKVNVQRRESVNTSTHRNFTGQKQQTEVKSSQPLKNRSGIQNNLQVQSSVGIASSSNLPLKQNNQKQNCPVDRVKLPPKHSISNTEGKKFATWDYSFGHPKSTGRVVGGSKPGVRKLGLEMSDRGKDDLHSNGKKFPRKKRSIERDQRFDKKQAVDNMLTEKVQMSIHSNNIDDRPSSLVQDFRKNGTDVVSFTFTAPLTRKVSGSDTSVRVESSNSGIWKDFRGKTVLLSPDGSGSSSIECNFIGDNALSALLEQKLRELIDKVEPHGIGSINDESNITCSSTSEHVSPALDERHAMSKLTERKQHSFVHDKPVGQYNFDYPSTDSPSIGLKHEFQLASGGDACSSNSTNIDAEQFLDVRHPSPVSVLEPSFSSESCDSSDSISREGNKLCSSIQGQDAIGLSSSKFNSVEADTELLDSASSITDGALVMKYSTGCNEWELEYIKDILCDVQLMFKDYLLGRSHEVINPYLFNMLENQNRRLERSKEESRLRRKAVFDCVRECLDFRCRKYVGGGFRMWEKGVAVLRRKEQLAKDVWKEISGWSGLGDRMVDELVDMDMSCWHGRWLDYEVDAFVLGVEVETQILDSLIEEVLADIL